MPIYMLIEEDLIGGATISGKLGLISFRGKSIQKQANKVLQQSTCVARNTP